VAATTRREEPLTERIERMRREGMTLREIADRLNADRRPAPFRSGTWTPLNVRYAASKTRRLQRD